MARDWTSDDAHVDEIRERQLRGRSARSHKGVSARRETQLAGRATREQIARTKKLIQAGDSYRARNIVLRHLGFANYTDYLCSPLWKGILQAVFRAKGRFCRLCGNHAHQGHHQRYALDDLTGECLDYIEPICRSCHAEIEFDENGRKLFLSQVRRKFIRLLAARQKELARLRFAPARRPPVARPCRPS